MATDHKAEAENYIELAGFTDRGDPGNAAIAEATLYLAEQQRIANLIAYADLLESQYREHALHPDEFDVSTKEASLARHKTVLRLIREGLGL